MNSQQLKEFDSDQVSDAFNELKNAYQVVMGKPYKPYTVYPEIQSLLDALQTLYNLPNPFVDDVMEEETIEDDPIVVRDAYKVKGFEILINSLQTRLDKTKDKHERKLISEQLDRIHSKFEQMI